jgi:hypothetical protein
MGTGSAVKVAQPVKANKAARAMSLVFMMVSFSVRIQAILLP